MWLPKRLVFAAALMLPAAGAAIGLGQNPNSKAPQLSPQISPAVIDESLEVTGETIDARQVKTRMTVPVLINGKGPYRFLIDSGADRSVIGAGLARNIGLQASGAVTLHDMAGSSRVETVTIDSLRVGSSEMLEIQAPALLEQHLGAQGLIGIDALSEQRLSMDFAAKTITIQDPSRPERITGGGDEIVVTARRRKGQLILTEATAGKLRLSAVIDTGAQVTVGNMALHAQIFGGRRPPTPVPITLTSVTGQSIVADLVYLPQLRIGRLTLENVPVAFVDVPPFKLFGLAQEPSLLIGTDVLEAFRRVSLDFRNRKVRFVLRG
jgi:predicted aspartyl protease